VDFRAVVVTLVVEVLQVTGNRFERLWRHWIGGRRAADRAFPPACLNSIEQEIGAGELKHRCEIRFVVEADMDLAMVRSRVTPRQRALNLFASLRVWDTEENVGLLLYVSFSDRSVELVVDRAIKHHFGDNHWQQRLAQLSAAYREDRFEAATIDLIRSINQDLQVHFPASEHSIDELPNRPTLM
jgi:uncharacterized membrane protein